MELVFLVIYVIWSMKVFARFQNFLNISYFADGMSYFVAAFFLGIFLIPLYLIVDILSLIFGLFFGRK